MPTGLKSSKKQGISLNGHLAEYLKADKEFMAGIRKGVQDCKAGRMQLWSEVKNELDIR